MASLKRHSNLPNFDLLTNLSQITINDLYIIDNNQEVNIKDLFVLKSTFNTFLNTYSNDYDYLIHLHNKQNVEINGGTLTDNFIQNYTKDGKANLYHQHQISDVIQLTEQLNGKRVKTDFNFKNVLNQKVDTYDITYVDENNQIRSLREVLEKLIDSIYGKDSPLSTFEELYNLWNTFSGGSPSNPISNYNWNNYFTNTNLKNGLVYGLIAFLQSEITAKIMPLLDTQDLNYYIPSNDKHIRKGFATQINSLIKSNNKNFISIYPIYNRLCFKNDGIKTLDNDLTATNPYSNYLATLRPILNYQQALILDNVPLEFMNNASIRINNNEIFKIQSGEYYWNNDAYSNLSIPKNNFQKDLLSLSDTSATFYNRIYDRSGKKYVLEDEIGGQQPLRITNYLNDEVYYNDYTKRYITVNNNLQETYQSNYQVVQQQKHYMFFNYDNFLDDSFLLNPIKQSIQNINNGLTNINTAITNLQTTDNTLNTNLNTLNATLDIHSQTLSNHTQLINNNTSAITNNTSSINNLTTVVNNTKRVYENNYQNEEYIYDTKINNNNFTLFNDHIDESINVKNYNNNIFNNNTTDIIATNKFISNSDFSNSEKYEYDFSYKLTKINNDIIDIGFELTNVKIDVNALQTQVGYQHQINTNQNLVISGCQARLDVLESDVALLQSLFSSYQNSNTIKYNYFNLVDTTNASSGYFPAFYNSETSLNYETNSTISDSYINLVYSSSVYTPALTKSGFYEFKLKLDCMKYSPNATKSSGTITIYMYVNNVFLDSYDYYLLDADFNVRDFSMYYKNPSDTQKIIRFTVYHKLTTYNDNPNILNSNVLLFERTGSKLNIFRWGI